MRLLITAIRKIIVFVIGLPLIVIGILLIPLPGPGLLIVLAGMAVLSIEFTAARTATEKLRHRLLQTIAKPFNKIDRLPR